MACKHRFLGKHIPDSLFPNWQVKHLFIGTYNPEWNRPKLKNANYFYGRSRHFWNAMNIFFGGNQPIDLSTEQAMIDFSRTNLIGFTDLISSVNDANITNPIHLDRIYSVKDSDLEKFNEIAWNTNRIIEFISNNPTINIYFTLLSTDRHSLFSKEIIKIEEAANHLGVFHKRLHSPTGMGIGSGSPQLNKLVYLWSTNSTLPKVDLALFPYSKLLAGKITSTKEITTRETSATKSITIEELYQLTIESSGKATLVDLKYNSIVKTLPTLINVIIPLIKQKHRHVIALNSTKGKQSPKNSQTLAEELFKFYLHKTNMP